MYHKGLESSHFSGHSQVTLAAIVKSLDEIQIRCIRCALSRRTRLHDYICTSTTHKRQESSQISGSGQVTLAARVKSLDFSVILVRLSRRLDQQTLRKKMWIDICIISFYLFYCEYVHLLFIYFFNDFDIICLNSLNLIKLCYLEI